MPNFGTRTGPLDVPRVLALVAAGMTSSDIAARLDCTASAVRWIRRLNGVSAPTGRRRVRPLLQRRCKWRECRAEFTSYEQRRRFCRYRCAQRWITFRRRLFKTDEEARSVLHQLYTVEGLTTLEIGARFGHDHAVIIRWMERVGIRRRRSGPRLHTVCMDRGCSEPVFRIVHATTGSVYGRQCQRHRQIHRRAVYDRYWVAKKEANGRLLQMNVRRLLAGVPESIKADVEQEVTVAVLLKEIELTAENVKRFVRRGFADYADVFRFVSLDAPAPGADDDGSFTWAHKLGMA